MSASAWLTPTSTADARNGLGASRRAEGNSCSPSCPAISTEEVMYGASSTSSLNDSGSRTVCPRPPSSTICTGKDHHSLRPGRPRLERAAALQGGKLNFQGLSRLAARDVDLTDLPGEVDHVDVLHDHPARLEDELLRPGDLSRLLPDPRRSGDDREVAGLPAELLERQVLVEWEPVQSADGPQHLGEHVAGLAGEIDQPQPAGRPPSRLFPAANDAELLQRLVERGGLTLDFSHDPFEGGHLRGGQNAVLHSAHNRIGESIPDRPHGGRFEPGCDNGVTYLVLQRVAQDFAELFGRLGPEG